MADGEGGAEAVEEAEAGSQHHGQHHGGGHLGSPPRASPFPHWLGLRDHNGVYKSPGILSPTCFPTAENQAISSQRHNAQGLGPPLGSCWSVSLYPPCKSLAQGDRIR